MSLLIFPFCLIFSFNGPSNYCSYGRKFGSNSLSFSPVNSIRISVLGSEIFLGSGIVLLLMRDCKCGCRRKDGQLRWANADAQVQGQAVRAIAAFVAAVPPRPFSVSHLQVLYIRSAADLLSVLDGYFTNIFLHCDPYWMHSV